MSSSSSRRTYPVSFRSVSLVCAVDCLCRRLAEVKRSIKNVNSTNCHVKRHIALKRGERIGDLITRHGRDFKFPDVFRWAHREASKANEDEK